jgi:cytidylate kinase
MDFEKCLPFVASHFHAGERLLTPDPTPRLAVTISRQSGSGGHAVAEKLAEYLQAHAPTGSLPWLVFDRNLVEKVVEEHKLPGRVVRFMPEDRVTDITDMIHEMFGLHPPFWTLVRLTSDTILHLAEQGNVILVGRGANLVTSKLPHVFHVRLIGSLEKRIEHIQEIRSLGKKAAAELVHDEDLGRERYLKKYFNKHPDDPMLYHLVINTDMLSYADAARLIADAALHNLRQRMAAVADHLAVRHTGMFATSYTHSY